MGQQPAWPMVWQWRNENVPRPRVERAHGLHRREEGGTGRPISRILSPAMRPGAIISLVPRVTPGILAPNLGLGGQRHRPCSGLLRVEFDSFHSRSRPVVAAFTERQSYPGHRLCATGPRLTADGNYPLPCPVECGLSSLRPACLPSCLGKRPDRSRDRPAVQFRHE